MDPAGRGLWLPKALPAPRPLLGLPDVLGASRVLVVEGEKCALAARTAWPSLTVTTWCGGTNAWTRTDWQPLASKTVTLLADADDSGRKAMTEIGERLGSLGCTVRLALPDGDDGDDVADWIEQDGAAAAARRIKGLLPPDEPADDLIQNEHYRLLGFAGDLIAIQIAAGRILQRTRESLCQPNTLTAVAPLLWWREICGDNLTANRARVIGDSLIRAADRLGAIDLAAIHGRGAARLPDGSVVWHLGDRLLRDGKESPLDSDDAIWLAEPPIRLARAASDGARLEFRDAVMGYRWGSEADGRRFLGWLASSVAGGALEWRPHLLLTAPASAGKSWILKRVVEPLLGSTMLRIADGTVAAVARATQASSLPLIVDEAEPSAAGCWTS